MSDKLNKVSNAYVKEVVPELIEGFKSDNIYTSSAGMIGDYNFYFEMNSNAYLDSLPAQYKPQSNKIVQFTSLKVLYSILNEHALRLYNLNNMNDPNELNFLFKNTNVDQEYINYYKENIYIASFCSSNILKSESILNLWRLYGSNGHGVAIEYEIDPDVRHKRDFVFARVSYRDIDIDKFLKANATFEEKYKVSVDYSELLKIPATMHKNSAYKIEEEERLIFFGKGAQMREMAEKDLQYKPDVNNYGQPVTYYKLPLYESKESMLPSITIKKIHFGFKHSQENFENIKQNLDSFFWGLVYAAKIKEEDIPSFELSPLKNIYR